MILNGLQGDEERHERSMTMFSIHSNDKEPHAHRQAGAIWTRVIAKNSKWHGKSSKDSSQHHRTMLTDLQ